MSVETCICRNCGRSGYTIDEFTSPYTGLCADCSDESDAAPMGNNKAVEDAIRKLGTIALEGKVPGTGYLFRADKVRRVLLDLLAAQQ